MLRHSRNKIVDRVFTHHVIDGMGDPIRRFQSKREAEWFIEGKPDCKIVQVAKRPRLNKPSQDIDWTNKEEECLF